MLVCLSVSLFLGFFQPFCLPRLRFVAFSACAFLILFPSLASLILGRSLSSVFVSFLTLSWFLGIPDYWHLSWSHIFWFPWCHLSYGLSLSFSLCLSSLLGLLVVPMTFSACFPPSKPPWFSVLLSKGVVIVSGEILVSGVSSLLPLTPLDRKLHEAEALSCSLLSLPCLQQHLPHRGAG